MPKQQKKLHKNNKKPAFELKEGNDENFAPLLPDKNKDGQSSDDQLLNKIKAQPPHNNNNNQPIDFIAKNNNNSNDQHQEEHPINQYISIKG